MVFAQLWRKQRPDMKPIIFYSARDIRDQIRSQAITCEEVARQFLAQIERHNPTINAITDLRPPAEILAEAREKDAAIARGDDLGLLHGLPMTVKDSFNVRGLITSNGFPQFKNHVATDDAELVTRLKAAGAIVMGKTNLPLFALDWQSTNSWFGQTNNPYNLNHVVGGSSGGSSAALAAGFTPLELGTDAGGSIRVPAHFCGICGLRTTESALPMRGNMVSPNALRVGRYLTCNGPMARNVDDLLLMMEVFGSTQQSISENPPVNLQQYTYTAGNPLRIAYSETLDGVELDAEYRDIFRRFLQRLHNVTEYSVQEDQPPFDAGKLIHLWGKIVGFDFGVALKGLPLKGLIAQLFIRGKFRSRQWARGLGAGAGGSKRRYARALEEKDNVSDQFSAFFRDYDLWVTPVSADKAFRHQKPRVPLKINGQQVPYVRAFTPYNFATSIPGHPILVIPIGRTRSGLPVGVQLHAQKWNDHRLLQMGQALERLTEGFVVPEMMREE